MTHALDSLLAALPPVVQAGWIDALGPLVLIVVYVVRQVFAAIAEQREAERAKQQQRNQQAKGAPEAPQHELRSEVDAFLERVNQARQRQESEQQFEETTTPSRGPVDPFEEPTRRKPKRAAEAEAVESPIELLVETEPPPARQEPPVPRKALTPKQAPNPTEERIASADQRTEARLHEKFDHQLGSFADKELPPPKTEAAEPVDLTAASRIRSLLSRPGGVREAVVLSEILQRRGDRL